MYCTFSLVQCEHWNSNELSDFFFCRCRGLPNVRTESRTNANFDFSFFVIFVRFVIGSRNVATEWKYETIFFGFRPFSHILRCWSIGDLASCLQSIYVTLKTTKVPFVHKNVRVIRSTMNGIILLCIANKHSQFMRYLRAYRALNESNDGLTNKWILNWLLVWIGLLKFFRRILFNENLITVIFRCTQKVNFSWASIYLLEFI